MRIVCPYCGDRDTGEFIFRGEAMGRHPGLNADEDAMFEHVYHRTNLSGKTREHWYHAQGCRNWIVVERDTLTHTIFSARLAKDGES